MRFKLMLTAVPLLFAACGIINQEEGDCRNRYEVQFTWNYNMLNTDAFSQNVRSVSLYAFEKETHRLVWFDTESGESLGRDGYRMELEGIPAGNYELVAWCGLENGAENESFILDGLNGGEGSRTGMVCKLNTGLQPDGTYFSQRDLSPLFHGKLGDVSIAADGDPDIEPGVHVMTMPLAKNTNNVRIILQHLSGEDVSADDFTYTIEAANAAMDADNNLCDGHTVVYREWQRSQAQAGIVINTKAGEETETTAKVAIADLTTARLVADAPQTLSIRNGDGETVCRIPLTDYLLLVKDFYGTQMTDQEYLDRQDMHTLTFFLDKNRNWVKGNVIINSWRVVTDNIEFND